MWMELVPVMLLVVPALATVVVALLGRDRLAAIRWVALAATLVEAGLGCVVGAGVLGLRQREPLADKAITFQPEFVPGALPGDSHRTEWTMVSFRATNQQGEPAAIRFFLGVDGISIWLVVLTALLMVPSVLISW